VYHIKGLLAAANGDTAILNKKKRPGRPPKVTEGQILLFLVEVNKGAMAHGYLNQHWTSDRLAKLLFDMTGVQYHPHNVIKIMHKYKYSYQRPIKVARQQNKEAVEKWKNEEYPQIVSQAIDENRDIFVLDESGASLMPSLHSTWAPIGITPVVEEWHSKDRISAIAALSMSGKLYFKSQNDTFKGKDFVGFLKFMDANNERDMTLIMDGCSIHWCELVWEYLATTKPGRFILERFPAYSPELNPTELIWAYVKYDKLKNEAFKSKDDLRYAFTTTLTELKCDPVKVKSYFDAVGYMTA